MGKFAWPFTFSNGNCMGLGLRVPAGDTSKEKGLRAAAIIGTGVAILPPAAALGVVVVDRGRRKRQHNRKEQSERNT